MSSNITNKEDSIENISKEDFVKLANQMGKQARSMVDHKQAELEEITISYSEMIREKPIKSVLLGFLAGIIVGKIFTK